VLLWDRFCFRLHSLFRSNTIRLEFSFSYLHVAALPLRQSSLRINRSSVSPTSSTKQLGRKQSFLQPFVQSRMMWQLRGIPINNCYQFWHENLSQRAFGQHSWRQCFSFSTENAWSDRTCLCAYVQMYLGCWKSM